MVWLYSSMPDMVVKLQSVEDPHEVPKALERRGNRWLSGVDPSAYGRVGRNVFLIDSWFRIIGLIVLHH